MSLIEQVRRIGADDTDITEENVRTARLALLRETNRARGGRRTRAHHRTLWAGIGVGGLVAAAAVVAMVVGSVLSPSATPSASAAEVLNAAAARTSGATVLHPAPGQYIRISETSTQTLGWHEDPSAPDGGWWESAASDTSAKVRIRSSLYVPADRRHDWIQTWGERFTVLSISGPDAVAAGKVLESEMRDQKTEVLPAGRYADADAPEDGGVGVAPPRNGMQCFYDSMPRDPKKLIAWLDAFEPASDFGCGSPDLADPVGFNLAPADLRETMFHALALVDGAKIVKAEGDVTTISFPEASGSSWRDTIDVDTARGLIVGRGYGSSDSWSSRVDMSIVDEAP